MTNIEKTGTSGVVFHEARRFARFEWKKPAIFHTGSLQFHCITVNISEGGVGIQGFLFPQSVFSEDSVIHMESLPPLSVRIAWRRGNFLGLSFNKGSVGHPEVAKLLATLEHVPQTSVH